MSDQVFERLRTLVCDQLDVPVEDFTESASFIEQLGADSLDLIDLVMRVEEEFELRIPDEDYVHFASVKQAVEYIAAHAGNATEAAAARAATAPAE